MVLKKFSDDIYPLSYIDHTRSTVRGLIINDSNQVAVLKIECEDFFGKRDHFELVGGGVEENESTIDAIKRESLEESGAVIKNIKVLGQVEQAYNLLHRVDLATIFYAYIQKLEKQNLQEEESRYIKNLQWIDIYQLKNQLENLKVENVGKLVHRRDLFILNEVLKDIENKENHD